MKRMQTVSIRRGSALAPLIALVGLAPGLVAITLNVRETSFMDDNYTLSPALQPAVGTPTLTPVSDEELVAVLGTHNAASVTHSGSTDNHTAPSNTHRTTSVTHNQWSSDHKATTTTHRAPSDDHQVTTKTIRYSPRDGKYYTHTPLSDYHRTGTDTTPWPDGESWHNPVSDTHYRGTDYHTSNTVTHRANTDNHNAASTTHKRNSVKHNSSSDTHYISTIVHKSNSDHLVPATPGGTPAGMPTFSGIGGLEAQ
jgi:hypothetical protein